MNPDEPIKKYFSIIEKETTRCYDIAKKVKAKGIDIDDEINIPIAKDLAARVEGLISSFYPIIKNCGVQDGIRALEKKYGKNSERVALEAGRDIAIGKYVKFESKKDALEMGLRIAVGYLTQGVVTAPLEGISEVQLKKNSDGSEYAAVYYAGPIRSAGGTASAISVVAFDFIRKALGIADYKPEEKEVKRYVTEIEDYSTRIVEKQYHPAEEEVKMMIENIPVEVTGDPTERLDVSNYKDLPRVETNKIRGGMCLVFLDGVPLKAEKVFKRIKKYPKDYGLKHWLWLEKFIKLKHKLHSVSKKDAGADEKYTPNTKYLSKIIAGRPVFSFPNTKGGFNLRYGRSRTGGIASTSVHPGAMHLVGFIAIGTQLAEELPGKATVGTVCDSINPPIVRLEDKSIVEIKTKEEAKKHRDDVNLILSMGDILVPYGEFANNGHILIPSSYVEEWWALEVQEELDKTKLKNEEKKDILQYTQAPFKIPDFLTALLISKKLNVPLHPGYNYFWHDINKENLIKLITGLQKAIENQNSSGDVVFDLATAEQTGTKQVLEDLCILHNIVNEKIIIKKNTAYSLLYCLGLITNEDDFKNNFVEKIESRDVKKIITKIEKSTDIMDAVNNLSGIKIMKKAPHRIGLKMGRPEKAERRILKGSPQVLFPCGDAGGKTRNLMETAEKKTISATVSNYICPACGKQTPFSYCFDCKMRTTLTEARREGYTKGTVIKTTYTRMNLAVDKLLKSAMKNVDEEAKPKLFKAVRGVMGVDRNVEFIEKGILRVKHSLFVNKDGTVRYDSMNVPLTHFRPREISVSVEKLKELGYTTDMHNKPLKDKDQILELRPQDILISDNSIFSGAQYLIGICKFVDDLLVKFYHEKPFYNAKTKEDLLGHLVVGLAPHTSAGVMGRIIGFTPAKVGYAHPFWHAAKRRNCLVPETNIPIISNNGKINIISISDLYKKTKTPEKIVDDFGTKQKTTVKIKTISLNKKRMLEEKNIVSVIKSPSPKHLIKIQLKSGRTFCASPEHVVLVSENDGKLKKKKLVEVNDKDCFLTAKDAKVKEIDIKEIDLLYEFSKIKKLYDCLMIKGINKELSLLVKKSGGLKQTANKLNLNKKTFSNYLYRDSIPFSVLSTLLKLHKKDLDFIPKKCKLGIKRDAVVLQRVIKIDKSFMKLVGYYIAEGYSRAKEKNCYQVSIACKEKEMHKDILNCISCVFRIKANDNENAVSICSKLIYYLFVDIMKIGVRAKDKRIPEFLINIPKEKMSYLLSAYFSGDGSVEKNRLHVSCCSISKNLLTDIGFQLMRFNIFYRVKKEQRPSGGLAKRFYEKKGENPIFTLYHISVRSSYARIFYEKIGFSLKRKQQNLKSVLDKERSPIIKESRHAINFIVEKIKKTEVVEAKSKYLYDIEVEDNHNFLINDFILTNNCDGDEDSIMMLMDALLNFSKSYLPDTRGGRSMDAPLVLTSIMNPEEVDDESWNVDIDSSYSLSFYKATLEYKFPWEAEQVPRVVENVIDTPEAFHIKYTHETTDINDGIITTKYVGLQSMEDKVNTQLQLDKKILAVDENIVAEKLLSKHFLKDIKGNLRTFSKQSVRCVSCNEKYRRIPLLGICTKCKGKLILSVSEGFVRKYIEPSKQIIEDYDISPYLCEQFKILEKQVDDLFGKKDRQMKLFKF